MADDVLFEPLRFRTLTVRNRVFRSNMSGRFDHYDGSGSRIRLAWEERFARGGVGAIISSFVPVAREGRIVPEYATIDRDARIPFWREVGARVHAYDCRFILQLSHSGRQQDIRSVDVLFETPLGATGRPEPFNGFPCRAMTEAEIRRTIEAFAQGARRAREAGLDGVELHGANGYLITQFLSSAINDRRDAWGGPLENRARFLLEIVAAIRREVGRDFHLQVKMNGLDYGNAVIPWERRGNTLADAVQVARWLEAAGVDALHVSAGNAFPHPSNPPGTFPVEWASRTYDALLASGMYTFSRYLLLRYRPLRPLFRVFWNLRRPRQIEGVNAGAAREIKAHVRIPVICTGGFQTASHIRALIGGGACDAVSIARPLIANPTLVQMFAAGADRPARPCTYCNKCLVNVVKHPLACYELSRFDGDTDRMMAEALAIFTEAHEAPAPPVAAVPMGS
jgi:2,4-dienoyl-CoA reductase-like NADH-dependent reductase (Old Yellow Enzyme family)